MAAGLTKRETLLDTINSARTAGQGITGDNPIRITEGNTVLVTFTSTLAGSYSYTRNGTDYNNGLRAIDLVANKAYTFEIAVAYNDLFDIKPDTAAAFTVNSCIMELYQRG